MASAEEIMAKLYKNVLIGTIFRGFESNTLRSFLVDGWIFIRFAHLRFDADCGLANTNSEKNILFAL